MANFASHVTGKVLLLPSIYLFTDHGTFPNIFFWRGYMIFAMGWSNIGTNHSMYIHIHVNICLSYSATHKIHKCCALGRMEAKDTWSAVIQLRQKVPHKKTFFYLEQLIIKHRAHRDCINIKSLRVIVTCVWTMSFTAIKWYVYQVDDSRWREIYIFDDLAYPRGCSRHAIMLYLVQFLYS